MSDGIHNFTEKIVIILPPGTGAEATYLNKTSWASWNMGILHKQLESWFL